MLSKNIRVYVEILPSFAVEGGNDILQHPVYHKTKLEEQVVSKPQSSQSFLVRGRGILWLPFTHDHSWCQLHKKIGHIYIITLAALVLRLHELFKNTLD